MKCSPVVLSSNLSIENHLLYKAEKLSVCLSKNSWWPIILSKLDARVEAVLTPNEALINQE